MEVIERNGEKSCRNNETISQQRVEREKEREGKKRGERK
jgi:hypothetical protein